MLSHSAKVLKSWENIYRFIFWFLSFFSDISLGNLIASSNPEIAHDLSYANKDAITDDIFGSFAHLLFPEQMPCKALEESSCLKRSGRDSGYSDIWALAWGLLASQTAVRGRTRLRSLDSLGSRSFTSCSSDITLGSTWRWVAFWTGEVIFISYCIEIKMGMGESRKWRENYSGQSNTTEYIVETGIELGCLVFLFFLRSLLPSFSLFLSCSFLTILPLEGDSFVFSKSVLEGLGQQWKESYLQV